MDATPKQSNSKITLDPVLSNNMDQGEFDYMIMADSPAQQELLSVVNESDGVANSVAHDDSSAYLDDYNELTVCDISHHIPDEDPSIIVSMLSIILHNDT